MFVTVLVQWSLEATKMDQSPSVVDGIEIHNKKKAPAT